MNIDTPVLFQSDLYSLGVTLVHLLIPHLHPYRNNINGSVETELEWWKERGVSKRDVRLLREFLLKFISSSFASQTSETLIQLCKIAVNLLNIDPFSRNYITPDMITW